MIGEVALHRLYCAIVRVNSALALISPGYAELVRACVAVFRTVDGCGLLDAVIVDF